MQKMATVTRNELHLLQDFHEEVVPHRAIIIQKEVAFVGHCGPWKFSGDSRLTSQPPLSASVGREFV